MGFTGRVGLDIFFPFFSRVYTGGSVRAEPKRAGPARFTPLPNGRVIQFPSSSSSHMENQVSIRDPSTVNRFPNKAFQFSQCPLKLDTQNATCSTAQPTPSLTCPSSSTTSPTTKPQPLCTLPSLNIKNPETQSDFAEKQK